jgi:hypothetical protein
VFRIEEGTSYTVPADRTFVLMGIGRRAMGTGQWGGGTFKCNSIVELNESNSPGQFTQAPNGITFPPGSVLEISDTYGAPADVYAVGYSVSTK